MRQMLTLLMGLTPLLLQDYHKLTLLQLDKP
jgi:hypothetical protein